MKKIFMIIGLLLVSFSSVNAFTFEPETKCPSIFNHVSQSMHNGTYCEQIGSKDVLILLFILFQVYCLFHMSWKPKKSTFKDYVSQNILLTFNIIIFVLLILVNISESMDYMLLMPGSIGGKINSMGIIVAIAVTLLVQIGYFFFAPGFGKDRKLSVKTYLIYMMPIIFGSFFLYMNT